MNKGQFSGKTYRTGTAGIDSVVRRLCIGANSIIVVYGVTNLFADKDPQGFIIVALFIYLTFASVFVGREV